jgi:BirA family biotin operon repressor/biotin-[acetyl-CoA-carboxylase] ligase
MTSGTVPQGCLRTWPVQRTVADSRGHAQSIQRTRAKLPRIFSNPPVDVAERKASVLLSANPADAVTGGRAVLAELCRRPAVSGSALAERLGVTRAAVWKQIGRLREAGVEIDAQPGSGYRLRAPLELLDPAFLRTSLAASTRARLGDLAVHWQVDSTNSELSRRAEHDPRDRLVCLAELQSAGRGRRGRAWRMPLGGGIAMSVLKRFEGPMSSLAGLSLAVGVAATEALGVCAIHEVALKWPNDLVARGAKLGGILVELGGDALGPCHAVVGVGLNFRLGATAAAIDQACIDLAALSAAPLSRVQVAARLVDHLVDALDRFAASGFGAFAAAYARHDALRGREVEVLQTERRRHGTARGIDARGAMRIAFAEGEEVVDSGEVSLRMRP